MVTTPPPVTFAETSGRDEYAREYEKKESHQTLSQHRSTVDNRDGRADDARQR